VGLSKVSVASTHPHCHFLCHSHMEKLFCMFPFLLLLSLPFASAGHDYGQALSKSLLFFEAQRSGYLPHNQRVTWRAHSGLQDGKASGVTSTHKKINSLYLGFHFFLESSGFYCFCNCGCELAGGSSWRVL